MRTSGGEARLILEGVAERVKTRALPKIVKWRFFRSLIDASPEFPLVTGQATWKQRTHHPVLEKIRCSYTAFACGRFAARKGEINMALTIHYTRRS